MVHFFFTSGCGARTWDPDTVSRSSYRCATETIVKIYEMKVFNITARSRKVYKETDNNSNYQLSFV